MTNNLSERTISLMSDGCWHPANELVEKISHRFSATMHVLKKRGYHFEKRKVTAQQYEYKMTVREIA
ncbi:hypothetical protein [Chamaesiphon sp.]|uniref:hypothetical protein n=1 Tax=Chamaesiphon sp. TaxID=2814140 RepID=UPI003593A384